ncbi:uncharacterized protein LOC124366271 [Homalodisca vitripennis]|uniref:uncharacterized protein LOC124366271 n=1 Tax=Homalodisca vitripennis TaxID=197043 RepID=UPI001EEC2E2C|nr:uncharacterized protein LOC124366271 [Homalodisca vitripennis]
MTCTPNSLKLKEMPLLCQKLGFNKEVLDDKNITDYGYDRKVLIGNWFENQSKPIESRKMDLNTIYRKDYNCKTPVLDPNSTWNNRLSGQRSLNLAQGKYDEFGENMSTVYDLAYRCRVRDFVSGNYGNATNYGKKECKQDYWVTQRDDRLLRFHTEYKDAYSFSPCASHITS